MIASGKWTFLCLHVFLLRTAREKNWGRDAAVPGMQLYIGIQLKHSQQTDWNVTHLFSTYEQIIMDTFRVTYGRVCSSYFINTDARLLLWQNAGSISFCATNIVFNARCIRYYSRFQPLALPSHRPEVARNWSLRTHQPSWNWAAALSEQTPRCCCIHCCQAAVLLDRLEIIGTFHGKTAC